ncbi:MAG TPA: right-handed parallel beta-helix repeat-containing protein [Burkholderiaceae bacterium]|nr:right-handed parallel beta-helix repeat-containing protein [Burkholderiaceae bacterium]
MTVSIQETRFAYVGNGSTVEFPYACQIHRAADMVVTVAGSVIHSGYTVTGVGNPSGGVVTFSAAPAAGQQVMLERIIPLERSTDYQQNGDFLSRVVNPDFDRLWMALQQFDAALGISPGVNGRVLQIPRNEQPIPPLVSAADRAGKLLSFDENGNPVMTLPATGSATELALELSQPDGGGVVGFVQRFLGSVSRTLLTKTRERVSVTDFGVFSNGADPMVNKATLQRAVDAVPAGCKLVIPNSDDGLPVVIDTSQGLSGAVKITRSVHIQIEGIIASNYGVMQANPPYMFDVQADGVSITGAGTIAGDGTVDDTNAGTIATMPGLIYVTGDRFTMQGLTIDTPPKIGVSLVGCKQANISDNRFVGGPVSYTEEHTAYFGVRMYLGGHHIVSQNHFGTSASGGKLINCIFGEGTDYCLISGNTADGVHEKLSYLFGSYNRVIGNVVNDSTITDAFRFYGSYNKLVGNHAVNVNGGTQIFDGVYNEVSSNTFIGCRQIGVNIGRSDPDYTGGFSGTKVSNNVIVGASSGVRTDGIRIAANGAGSTGIDVSGNIVSNFAQTAGEGLIRVIAVSPYSIDNLIISNNTINGGWNAIVVQRVADSRIQGNVHKSSANVGILISGSARISIESNTLISPGTYGVDLQDSTSIAVLNNRVHDGANIGILGITNSNCYGRGNQYNNMPLVGDVTLAAAVSTTVTHGGVAPNARIMLQEKNSLAGIMLVNKGRCYAGPSGGNFVINVANGTSADGTEQFHYEIIQ